jgi:hypothetical protein
VAITHEALDALEALLGLLDQLGLKPPLLLRLCGGRHGPERTVDRRLRTSMSELESLVSEVGSTSSLQKSMPALSAAAPKSLPLANMAGGRSMGHWCSSYCCRVAYE